MERESHRLGERRGESELRSFLSLNAISALRQLCFAAPGSAEFLIVMTGRVLVEYGRPAAEPEQGVKIYDTSSGTRIGYIDRGANAPRAELYQCTLLWKDDQTLLIAWADYIKIVRVRPRQRAAANSPPLVIEMTAIYQVDCMISGIASYGSSYVILAYVPPDA
jgi:hypothetical protein